MHNNINGCQYDFLVSITVNKNVVNDSNTILQMLNFRYFNQTDVLLWNRLKSYSNFVYKMAISPIKSPEEVMRSYMKNRKKNMKVLVTQKTMLLDVMRSTGIYGGYYCVSIFFGYQFTIPIILSTMFWKLICLIVVPKFGLYFLFSRNLVCLFFLVRMTGHK